MEKRRIENLGIETSLLGFGCMRFPLDSEGNIDKSRTEKMIDNAISKGVNYIDTAYPYHDGKSELVVGEILEKYPRDSFYLATKMPVWLIDSKEKAAEIFEEQLAKLRTDYIDFYLLHAIGKDRFEQIKEQGLIEFCEEMQKQGKIKYFGFSFHDTYEAFEEIASYRKWDFCQIQINYMDTEDGPGIRGVELAEKLNIPLVIMEPIKGGNLANLSPDLVEKLEAVNPGKSVASFALRWVASHSQVKVILSGMSDEAQVEDNLDTFVNYVPMSEKEKDTIDEIARTMKNRVQNGCTGCRYCMPCPFGVDIPKVFSLWNKYHVFQNYWAVNWEWERMDEKSRPDVCVKCGKCEKACPQHLSIREDLVKANNDLLNPIYKK